MANFLFEMSVMYAHCNKHLCHHLDFPCDVFLCLHLYLIYRGHFSFCNGRDLQLPSFIQQWE